ncbi:thiamine diphosphokinase [Clostridium sp. 'White wine YQ']|uniref:thiamine diphosphokinase n=1 Tax=Clostridium sp. 'White wine YQ' TaxID=3027474 RepID=UPI002365B4CB|nr:thiamine diphosphokinase [Clostridium sp. 'White wine YQ']MDD7793748.1 thiamine diphosphokinase [Clostridium sp. 'White wine YQ']
MKVIIVAGGTPPSKELLLEAVKDAECIIAADKGTEVLLTNNIVPDYVLGDFDSIDKKFLDDLSLKEVNVIKHNPIKDFTDTDSAFNKALELKAKEITLLGCTGTRIDHLFSNIGLLKKALENNVLCKIIDDNNVIQLTNKPMTFKGKRGQLISFYAYEEVVEDFSIYGAKYELFKHKLIPFDGLTVSNEFLDGDINITFNKGLVLIFFSKD